MGWGPVAWWEWSCWGSNPNNGAPSPQSCFFVSWSGTRIMSCAQHAMTVGHCAIHLGGWGATSPPATCRVKVQRICILRHLNLGLMLPNNTWMVMHFFMCIVVQSHRKFPKVQNFQFSSFLSERKCVCSVVLVGWCFSNLIGKQPESHRSVPRSALHVTTSEWFF